MKNRIGLIAFVLVVLCAGMVVAQVPCPPIVDIVVAPNTLNLQSNGNWVTVHVDVKYSDACPNPDCYTLNDMVVADVAKADDCGYLALKFSLDAVKEIVEVGDDVEMIVDGFYSDLLGGAPFSGTDYIRVIDKGGKEKGGK